VIHTDITTEYAAGDFVCGTRDWYVRFWFWGDQSQTGGNDLCGINAITSGLRDIRWSNNINLWSMAYADGGGAENTYWTFGAAPTDGAWHEVVFERVGDSLYCYQDGVQNGTTKSVTGHDIGGNLTTDVVVTVGGGLVGISADTGTPKVGTHIDAFDMKIGVNLNAGVAPGSAGTEAPVTFNEAFVVGDALFDTRIDGLTTTITSAATQVDGTLNVTGAVTALSYGGITEANLVDKTDTEEITGIWTLDAAVTESDFGTGGKVKDGLDVAQPIGFNTMPVYEIDVSDTFDLAHNGMLWHKDSGVAVTFTCDQDTTIPQGATYVVHNDDTEDLTIAQGAGVTIEFLAAGAPPVAGNVTVEQGGLVTVYKYSDTVFWVWGATAAAATHTGEVTGDTALTLDVTSITNRSTIVADSLDELALRDTTDGTLRKTSLGSITDGGYF
jgi:hypothetical protein